jgi:hypothetical protein
LAIKFKCPIINIIHVNPGSDQKTFKTRGHLGSQLERKSETNLKIAIDTHGVSTIWADKNRHAPIPRKTAPHFAWSNKAKMHVMVAVKADEEDNTERDALVKLFTAVFVGHATLSYSELVAAVKKHEAVSDKTAERRIKVAVSSGVLEKTKGKAYKLKA